MYAKQEVYYITSITATNARHNFFEILKSATQKREFYHIEHSKDDVISMSEDKYESLLGTLAILSTSEFLKKILTKHTPGN